VVINPIRLIPYWRGKWPTERLLLAVQVVATRRVFTTSAVAADNSSAYC
jgi:hypothetical protein